MPYMKSKICKGKRCYKKLIKMFCYDTILYKKLFKKRVTTVTESATLPKKRLLCSIPKNCLWSYDVLSVGV